MEHIIVNKFIISKYVQIVALKRRRMTALLVVVLLVTGAVYAPVNGVFAYYDRGQVGLTVAQSQVSLEAGKRLEVTVSAYPDQDLQTPGCGMEECPQICGDLGCFDDIGQCVCNGTTYTIYYPQITVASSDSSVVQADYSGGVLTITGISPGRATIAITAGLRQFRDNWANIEVSVEAVAGTQGGSGGIGSSGGSDAPVNQAPNPSETPESSVATAEKLPSTNTINKAELGVAGAWKIPVSRDEAGAWKDTGSVAGEAVQGIISTLSSVVEEEEIQTPKADAQLTQDSTNQNSDPDDKSENFSEENVIDPEVVESDNPIISTTSGRDGIVRIIAQLGALGVNVRELLARVAGKDETITFRELDESGNVRCSFTFRGKDLKPNADFDIDLATTITEGHPAASDALVLSFRAQKPLPAPVEVYVAVGTRFPVPDAGFLGSGKAATSDATGAYSGTQLSGARKLTQPEAKKTSPEDESIVLNVYHSNATNDLVKIADGITVSRGYAIFTIDSTDDIIITAAELDGETKGRTPASSALIGAGVLTVLAIGGVYINRKRTVL